MADDDFQSRRFAVTTPDDQADPPRFTQLSETVADAFVYELRAYFDKAQTSGRLAELPTIDKYSIGYGAGQDPLATAVAIFQDFPDVIESLPTIAVTNISLQHKPLSFGPPFIGHTQYPPRVVGANVEPFAITDGTVLRYRTQPRHDGVWVESAVRFRASAFMTPGAATAADIARVINGQALYAHARAVAGAVHIETGGPLSAGTPNAIEILGTSDTSILTVLGFVGGQADDSDNPLRPPMNRYCHSADASVSVDVYAEDPNTRRELADLVYSFFTFWLERKYFEFLGRSVFDETIVDEHYQITLGSNVRAGPPQSTQRPEDSKDLVHIQRIDVPCVVMMYLDRPVRVTYGPETGNGWTISAEDLTQDDDLPDPS